MEAKHISIPAVSQKTWTAEDVSNQLGRLFFSRREGNDKAQVHVRIQALCSTTEAFDHLITNVGGLEALKYCMSSGNLLVHASNPEVFAYINTILDE